MGEINIMIWLQNVDRMRSFDLVDIGDQGEHLCLHLYGELRLKSPLSPVQYSSPIYPSGCGGWIPLIVFPLFRPVRRPTVKLKRQ